MWPCCMLAFHKASDFLLHDRLNVRSSDVLTHAWHGDRILGEDKAMVEQLRPQLVLHEAGVRADIPQQRFRALRQEYINLGYGVEPEAPDNRVRIDF